MVAPYREVGDYDYDHDRLNHDIIRLINQFNSHDLGSEKQQQLNEI